MRNTNDFSNVVVGDKLWSIQLGDCVVIKNNGVSVLCKTLTKENIPNTSYWHNGKVENYEHHQSLFFSNPNIIAPEEPIKIPDLKVDDKVIVSNLGGLQHGLQRKRHFSHFNEDGRIFCFFGGKTSFTTSDIESWDSYEVVKG